MPTLPGTFVWFDYVTRDLAASTRFYGEVFGWTVESFPIGADTYPMIEAGEVPVGGFDIVSRALEPQWLSSLSVDDVDRTLRAIVECGGSVVEAPQELPGIGVSARVVDAVGATFYVFRGFGEDQPDRPWAHGTFHWNELQTPDAARAVAFYERALGYTHREMEVVPGTTYHLLERDGVPRGGIFAVPHARSQWLPHVAVDDCDAAVARAIRGGARVLSPPEDVPDVGRFAVLADPAGASIAVIRPAS